MCYNVVSLTQKCFSHLIIAQKISTVLCCLIQQSIFHSQSVKPPQSHTHTHTHTHTSSWPHELCCLPLVSEQHITGPIHTALSVRESSADSLTQQRWAGLCLSGKSWRRRAGQVSLMVFKVWQLNRSLTLQIKEKFPTLQPAKQCCRTNQQYEGNCSFGNKKKTSSYTWKYLSSCPSYWCYLSFPAKNFNSHVFISSHYCVFVVTVLKKKTTATVSPPNVKLMF